MSGCTNTNTTNVEDINYKNHQIVMERIDQLDVVVNSLTEMYKQLSINVAGFYDNKTRQFADNIKISKKIDDLEEKIVEVNSSHVGNHIIQLNENVKMIERIEKLESKVDSINFLPDLINRAIKIFQDNDGLKPHKCPVCNGNGNHLIDSVEEYLKHDSSRIRKCEPCEGKGIVFC